MTKDLFKNLIKMNLKFAILWEKKNNNKTQLIIKAILC